MPKEDGTYLVQPISGELGLRYYVESWSQPSSPHIVDLSRHNGYGECDCWNWLKYKSKAIRKALAEGVVKFDKTTLCQHTNAAHKYWHTHALPAYVASHQQQRHNHDE